MVSVWPGKSMEWSHWSCKQGRSWCSSLFMESTGKRRQGGQGESQSCSGVCRDPGWKELKRSSLLKLELSLTGPGFGERDPANPVRQEREKKAGKDFSHFPRSENSWALADLTFTTQILDPEPTIHGWLPKNGGGGMKFHELQG